MMNLRTLNIKIKHFCLFFSCILIPFAAAAQERPSKYEIPDGIYIDLTKEFHKALKNNSSSGNRVYTNDKSIQYLQEIAISSKYMVETNLQILKQQEMILNKLKDLLEE